MKRTGRLWVVAAAVACLVACGPKTKQSPLSGTAAVQDALRKQLATPEQLTDARRARDRVALAPGESVWLQAGTSKVLQLPRTVTRVSVGNPDIASVVVLGSRTVLVNAAPPTDGGQPATSMDGQTQTMGVSSFAPSPVRTGTARGPLVPPSVSQTTLIFWGPDDRPETHSLVVANFVGQQVMLEVTVAELNRTALEEHGIDIRQIGSSFASAYFMGGGLGPAIPGFATTVPPVPPVPLLPLTLGAESPNFVFRLPKNDITGFITLLQSEGMANILAQPTLLALSGQKAVFQVGGEIPIRIVTGFVADVEFKPFGTIVEFLPQVTEDGDILLTVEPEVSAPDFTNQVEDIPTFRTRRASTSVKLRDGETLAIGGLIQKVRRERVRGVPYLQDIPVLGYVFRETSFTEENTELVVIVTPRLAQPVPPGEPYELPTDRGPLTNEDIRTKPDEAEATRPRIPGIP